MEKAQKEVFMTPEQVEEKIIALKHRAPFAPFIP
jgi:hypothetical protein